MRETTNSYFVFFKDFVGQHFVVTCDYLTLVH